MAKGFDTLNIKSAVKARNRFDLSRTHLTTMNIGQIVPLFSEETIAGDDIKVNSSIFSRMAPLVHPTYGKFSFKTMAAYVPYHQVAEDFEGWVAGKNTIEGESTKFRCFTVYDLVLLFLNGTYVEVGTSANTQFTYIASNGSVAYRTFTKEGRYFLKVLNSLGYVLPQGVDLQTGSDWLSGEGTMKLSAYPLLAFFKAYNDYMSQSQRFNVSSLSTFLRAVKQGKTVTGYTPATGVISWQGLRTMFSNLKLCYDNDYFTSAWREPNMALPSVDNDSLTSAYVPAYSDGSYVLRDSEDNSVTNGTAMFQLGQRALDWLKSFDDWVRRNNYSGSRAVQQIYSRFGIKTDDFRTHYAHILGTDAVPIQVGDITSTSDATGAQLGAYAGKGIANGGKTFECKADDYGLFIILGWITVSPMNAYGFDRKVLRNQPLDYYNPEFDGIGADAISAGEYFVNPTVSPSGDTTSDLDIYGYTERYNSYRFGRDMITGDFRNMDDTDTQDNSWHTGRLLTTVRQAGNLLAQSPSIINMDGVTSEYNRMFSITDGSVDLFYITANFNVDAIRPILNHNQVPQLGEGNTTVPRNGNTIN